MTQQHSMQLEYFLKHTKHMKMDLLNSFGPSIMDVNTVPQLKMAKRENLRAFLYKPKKQ